MGPLTTLAFALSLSSLLTVHAAECTVAHSDDGSDDSPMILQAFQECAIDSTITFQRANYSAHTPVSLTGLRMLLLPPHAPRTLITTFRKRYCVPQWKFEPPE